MARRADYRVSAGCAQTDLRNKCLNGPLCRALVFVFCRQTTDGSPRIWGDERSARDRSVARS
jgi:hypothetical protein